MELTLRRIAFKPTYTIGKLYIDGEFFCDTLEDTDRGLETKMTKSEIAEKKIKGKTCIPYGKYEITLDVVSNKYSNFVKYPYAKPCNGRIPRLLNVPGFEGILIHPGTTENDTDGCILVGKNSIVGKLTNSQDTWKRMYEKLSQGKFNGITIEITK